MRASDARPGIPDGPHALAAVVKGGGEVGTAIALGLWRAGWRVAVSELPRPTVLRRQLSLAEAAFSGHAIRDNVAVVRVSAAAQARALLTERSALPLYLGPDADLVAAVQPAVVVDARMRRGTAPDDQRHQAPLVIGIGPELGAGVHVDAVIETCPGPNLGQVIWRGAALAHVPLVRSGDPDRAERHVHAPAAGLWRTEQTIGTAVVAGAVLGRLAGAPILAPVAGSLRGLVHDGVPVPRGLKVAAIHPGDWQRKEAGIGYRAASIAAAVQALAEQQVCAAVTAAS
jgi:xanthine dehydrogenase accessory factor